MKIVDREPGFGVSRTGTARSTDRQRVVVVGAGIAGLAAAYTLQKHNIDVLVLEASDVLFRNFHSVCLQKPQQPLTQGQRRRKTGAEGGPSGHSHMLR